MTGCDFRARAYITGSTATTTRAWRRQTWITWTLLLAVGLQLPGCKRSSHPIGPEERQVRDAISALKAKIRANEDDAALYLERGQKYFELGELCARKIRQKVYDAAIQDFKTCHDKTPGGSGRALLRIGHVYMRLYQLREAIPYIEEAARLSPDDIEVRAEQARLPGFTRNDWATSVAELEKLAALPEGQSSRNVWWALARSNDTLGRAEAAEAGYRKILEIDSQDRAALISLGMLLGSLERGDEGVPLIKSVLDRNRDDMYAAHNLAIVLEGLGRYDEAVKVMEPVVLGGDSFAAAWVQMVRLYLLVDRPADAHRVLAYAESVVAQNSSMPHPMVQAARAGYERHQGNYQAALAEYRDLLVQRPGDSRAARQLVETCDEAGSITSALPDLHAMINQMPAAAEPYVIRGNISARTGQFVAALEDYTRAIERQDIATYRMARGVTRWQAGDRAGAVADLEQALELTPGEPYSAMLLWDMLLQGGDTSRAAEVIAAAVEHTHPNAWRGRLARYIAGDLDEAALLQAAGGAERQCEAAFYVGLKRRHTSGRFSEAEPWFQKCVATDVRYFIEHRLATWLLAHPPEEAPGPAPGGE